MNLCFLFVLCSNSCACGSSWHIIIRVQLCRTLPKWATSLLSLGNRMTLCLLSPPHPRWRNSGLEPLPLDCQRLHFGPWGCWKGWGTFCNWVKQWTQGKDTAASLFLNTRGSNLASFNPHLSRRELELIFPGRISWDYFFCVVLLPPFSPFVHSCRHVSTHTLTNCPPGSFLILSPSLEWREALVFRILLNCKTLVLGMNRCSLHLLAPSSGYLMPPKKR